MSGRPSAVVRRRADVVGLGSGSPARVAVNGGTSVAAPAAPDVERVGVGKATGPCQNGSLRGAGMGNPRMGPKSPYSPITMATAISRTTGPNHRCEVCAETIKAMMPPTPTTRRAPPIAAHTPCRESTWEFSQLSTGCYQEKGLGTRGGEKLTSLRRPRYEPSNSRSDASCGGFMHTVRPLGGPRPHQQSMAPFCVSVNNDRLPIAKAGDCALHRATQAQSAAPFHLL